MVSESMTSTESAFIDDAEPYKTEDLPAVQNMEKKKRGRKPKDPVAEVPTQEVINEEAFEILETASAAEEGKRRDKNNSSEPTSEAEPEPEPEDATSPVEVKRRRGRPVKSDNVPVQNDEHRDDKIVSGKTGRAAKTNKMEPSKESEKKKNVDVEAVATEGPRKSSRNKGEPAKSYQEVELTPKVDKKKGSKKVETSKVKASEEKSDKTNSKADDVKVDEKKKRGRKKADDSKTVAEEKSQEDRKRVHSEIQKKVTEPEVNVKKRGAKKKDDITPIEEDEDSSPAKQRKKDAESSSNEEVESPVKVKRGRKKKDLASAVNEVINTFSFKPEILSMF
jgi:hypothetical protein